MPTVDTALLPLCVGLTLLGIIATGIAWRRGNKGRVVQGVGLALAPVALYFSGLLRLLWNGIVAVGTWASTLIFSPPVWVGMALLAFTGLDALQSWQPAARPVPVTLDHAAATAQAEGATAVLVDCTGPAALAIEGEVLAALAAGHRLVETADGGFGWAIPAPE